MSGDRRVSRTGTARWASRHYRVGPSTSYTSRRLSGDGSSLRPCPRSWSPRSSRRRQHLGGLPPRPPRSSKPSPTGGAVHASSFIGTSTSGPAALTPTSGRPALGLSRGGGRRRSHPGRLHGDARPPNSARPVRCGCSRRSEGALLAPGSVALARGGASPPGHQCRRKDHDPRRFQSAHRAVLPFGRRPLRKRRRRAGAGCPGRGPDRDGERRCGRRDGHSWRRPAGAC